MRDISFSERLALYNALRRLPAVKAEFPQTWRLKKLPGAELRRLAERHGISPEELRAALANAKAPKLPWRPLQYRPPAKLHPFEGTLEFEIALDCLASPQRGASGSCGATRRPGRTWTGIAAGRSLGRMSLSRSRCNGGPRLSGRLTKSARTCP